MGGLITRHMLATIEKEGKEHYVQTWISFDSPQKGANIPLGLQYSMDFLSRINTSGIYYVKDGLESAQQQFAKAGSILNQGRKYIKYKSCSSDVTLPLYSK